MESPNFLTIKDTREQIRKNLDSQGNFSCPVRELNFAFDEKHKPLLHLQGYDLTIDENNFQVLSNLIGFPPPDFMERLSANEKLHNEVVNFCLSLQSEKLVSIHYSKDSNEVLTIEDHFRESLNPVEIFDYCCLGLPIDTSVESVHLNNKFEIRFITSVSDSPKKRKGDITRAGIFLSGSGTTIEIGEYAIRLVCLNGLIGEIRKLKRRVSGEKEGRQILTSVKESVKTVFDDAKNRLLPAFMESDEVELRNPAQFVHHFARNNRISSDMEARLLDRVPSLPETSTFYDLINLFTSYGSEISDVSLLKFGNKVLEEAVNRSCSRCHRPLICR